MGLSTQQEKRYPLLYRHTRAITRQSTKYLVAKYLIRGILAGHQLQFFGFDTFHREI